MPIAHGEGRYHCDSDTLKKLLDNELIALKYMKQVCLDRYKQFWCEGQASKIKQNSTNYFADLYAKGDLDPKVKASV